jgi:hypothetical protein
MVNIEKLIQTCGYMLKNTTEGSTTQNSLNYCI